MFCLEKSPTGFHIEKVIVFPLVFRSMFNIHKEIRIFKTSSPIQPLPGKCRHSSRSITKFTIETNGKLISRLEYHFVDYISLALESRPKAFVLVYFLLFNRILLIALDDDPKHIAVVHPI